jgi:hypothetical protein
MSLSPRGMSIQEAYRLYADNRLTVNRRYQRKLVWSEAEKRRLIDSVEKELPIPLFMFVRGKADPEAIEIIDGMQRLNAIFSFIEHKFLDESSRCFDVDQFSRAKIVRNSGVFTEYQTDTKRLTAEECARFLEYQLAVTIDTGADDERVNEVFGRINSGGRQLSPQEQRQAGLVSPFSEFVRRLALELRGDTSPDILVLNRMPEVSFNTPKERQRYGIDASDVFWCKHGIIPADDLARSEDEQIISDFSISLLTGKPLNASREVFDIYFEANRYEFKLGLCELNEKPALDPGMFDKITRTACAIANTNPRHEGFIYLGVADKESGADRVKQLFGIQPIKIGDVFFVGLSGDLKILGLNLDSYIKRLILEISKLPLSEPLRTQIITSIDHAEYQGRPFLRIRVPGQDDLSSYNSTYPVRKNSETMDMSPTEAVAQSRLFRSIDK